MKLKLLAGMIVWAGVAASGTASAASAVVLPEAGLHAGTTMLETVRWEQRCHREMTRGRDQFGRRIEEPRRVCRRIWVGPRR